MGQLLGEVDGFPGKRFKDAARGDLELGTLESEADRKRHDEELKESKGLLKRVKDAVGDRVLEVRVSTRLTESPACLVLGEHDLAAGMRRILAAAGQSVPESKPVLELNVAHPLVRHLDGLADAARFKELSLILYDQAQLAESGQLGNPAEFVQRLNRLLVELAAPHPGA